MEGAGAVEASEWPDVCTHTPNMLPEAIALAGLVDRPSPDLILLYGKHFEPNYTLLEFLS